MKIISVLFLILFVASGSFAQIPTLTDQSSTTLNPVTIPDNQSFLISKIYPNPVKDVVSIEIQSQESGLLKIKLYNILGTEIKNWEPVNITPVDQKLKLDLSFLRSGVYILKFSKSDQVFSQVIKKN